MADGKWGDRGYVSIVSDIGVGVGLLGAELYWLANLPEKVYPVQTTVGVAISVIGGISLYCGLRDLRERIDWEELGERERKSWLEGAVQRRLNLGNSFVSFL